MFTHTHTARQNLNPLQVRQKQVRNKTVRHLSNQKGFMPNKKNQLQVELLTEKVKKAQSIAVVDYSGTTVSDMTSLRSQVKKAGGEVFVAKNTLIDIAIGKGKVSDSLTGMNAIVLSYQDAVSAMKSLFGFHKESNKLSIKQGFMPEEDKVLSPDQVKQLSEMPSKTELIQMLIGRIQAPAYGLANVLKANQRNLVYALKAVAEKQ